jgi:hypothetical protein
VPAEWWWPNSLPIRYKHTRRKKIRAASRSRNNQRASARENKADWTVPGQGLCRTAWNFRVELFPTTGGSPTDPAKLLSSKVAFYDAQPPKPIPGASSRSRAIRGGLIQRRQRKVVNRAELSWRPGYIPRSRTPSNKERQRLALFFSPEYPVIRSLSHCLFRKSIDQPCSFSRINPLVNLNSLLWNTGTICRRIKVKLKGEMEKNSPDEWKLPKLHVDYSIIGFGIQFWRDVIKSFHVLFTCISHWTSLGQLQPD